MEKIRKMPRIENYGTKKASDTKHSFIFIPDGRKIYE